MVDTIFSIVEPYFVYAVEVPVVLAIVVIFIYIMYSLNLFRKE
jgi:hypothetical protein